MATTSTKPRKTAVKKINDLSEIKTIVETPEIVETPQPAEDLPVPASPRFVYLTKKQLRRSVLNDPDLHKHCKLMMNADNFQTAIEAGKKAGVTWDEIVRAVITKECHEPIPFASALKFLPIPSDLD